MVLKTSEDFLVFDIFVQELFDERPNNVSSVASESVQNSFFFVKFPKRATRFGVNVQTVLNSFGLIIISLQRGRKFKSIFNSNCMCWYALQFLSYNLAWMSGSPVTSSIPGTFGSLKPVLYTRPEAGWVHREVKRSYFLRLRSKFLFIMKITWSEIVP